MPLITDGGNVKQTAQYHIIFQLQLIDQNIKQTTWVVDHQFVVLLFCF